MSSKHEELQELLDRHKSDKILLNQTNLVDSKNISLPIYVLHRENRLILLTGGLCIKVKTSINHNLVVSPFHKLKGGHHKLEAPGNL